jgi:hypothetical protein
VITEFTIVVSPSFDRRGKRRPDRFDARLKDDAEVIWGATRQPLLDASRVLLVRGFDPSTVLCMVYSHASTTVTLHAPIGIAAQYDVMGSAFVRRKPAPGPMPSSGIANAGSAGPRVPGSTEAAVGVPHKDPPIALRTRPPAPSPTSTATSRVSTSTATRPHRKEVEKPT